MKRMLLITISVLLSRIACAQLIYQNNHLTFNGNQFENSYSTTWRGWAHAWVDGTNLNRYLTFVLSNNDPRIGSGSGKIAFYKSGHGYNSIEVNSVFYSSDERLKSDIQELNGVTSTILSIRPVTYYKHGTYSVTPVSMENSKEYGFIAQEIEKVLPDIVIENDDGIKLVNYTALIPLLTATIQELNERITILEGQIEQLSK